MEEQILSETFNATTTLVPDLIEDSGVSDSNDNNGVMEQFGITGLGFFKCLNWDNRQHPLFQLANALFAIGYLAPTHEGGTMFTHAILIIGFMFSSFWAWNVICAPDIFSWNFAFMFLNIAQLLHVIYQTRPVQFDPELEEAYFRLFSPFKISRLTFKRMVHSEFATLTSLHAGEAYAMQDITPCDRLALLLSGKVHVMRNNDFLHSVYPCEFMDSIEFESNHAASEDLFRVSIIAASSCRYIYWQRSALEYLFTKDTYLSNVISLIVSRHNVDKLYRMNRQVVTDDGNTLDVRLHCVARHILHNPSFRPIFNNLAHFPYPQQRMRSIFGPEFDDMQFEFPQDSSIFRRIFVRDAEEDEDDDDNDDDDDDDMNGAFG